MGAGHAVLVCLLAVMNTAQLGTPEEYRPEDVPQLAFDFELEYEIRDRDGSLIADAVVDAVTVVRIVAPEGVTGPHDLVMYFDSRFIGSQTFVTFPFESKWNFKGLVEGAHTLVLVFTNADGDKGIVRLNVTVRHS